MKSRYESGESQVTRRLMNFTLKSIFNFFSLFFDQTLIEIDFFLASNFPDENVFDFLVRVIRNFRSEVQGLKRKPPARSTIFVNNFLLSTAN